MKTKKELMELSKGNLCDHIIALRASMVNQTTALEKNKFQIRNMKLRLRKVRTSINYILNSPYGDSEPGKTNLERVWEERKERKKNKK